MGHLEAQILWYVNRISFSKKGVKYEKLPAVYSVQAQSLRVGNPRARGSMGGLGWTSPSSSQDVGDQSREDRGPMTGATQVWPQMDMPAM